MDEASCSVEVKGVNEIVPVMRVRTAPQGRNYRIERTEKTDGGRWRLTLDVTTLLGRDRIVSVIEKIELNLYVTAHTGYLYNTHLHTIDGKAARIQSAYDTNHEHTTVLLYTPLENLTPSQWLEAADCLHGNRVLLNTTQ